MDGKDNFSSEYSFSALDDDVRLLKKEQLSYASITLTFDKDAYNESCLKKNHLSAYDNPAPLICIKQKGIYSFVAQLQQEDWVMTSQDELGVFHRSNYPLQISADYNGNVTLTPVTLADVNTALTARAARISEAAALKNNTDSVLESLK